jgi:CRP-like cAMP-binding protein
MTKTTRNRVLCALNENTRQSALRAAELAELAEMDVLEQQGETTSHVHFPETAVISTLTEYSDGSVIEMANVGSEACTGIGLLLGNSRQLTTEEIQIAGDVWQMPVDAFQALKSSNRDFECAVQAAAQSVLFQIMISGACNGAHSASQRLARWLLTMRDRSGSEDLLLTHDFLSKVLGLRRGTITEAANRFRERGLIDYTRGRVRIADRAGLEAESCECYRRVRDANKSLLPEK